MHITKVEFNWQRKVWHTSGALMMLIIFFLWQGRIKFGAHTINGIDFMVAFAWMETCLCLAIDALRFYSDKQRESVKKIPLFGSWIRKHEEHGFNTATYYVLASAILITALKFGWGDTGMLISAILVLGLGDPLAASTRYGLSGSHETKQRFFGLVVFVIISMVIIFIVSAYFGPKLTAANILLISLVCGLVETYTPQLVILVRPITKIIQRPLKNRNTQLLTKLYPDDNLLIPLVIWILMFWFSNH